MATYAITLREDDDWGDAPNRFKYKSKADARFREIAATNHFVRLIVWNKDQPTELERANQPTR